MSLDSRAGPLTFSCLWPYSLDFLSISMTTNSQNESLFPFQSTTIFEKHFCLIIFLYSRCWSLPIRQDRHVSQSLQTGHTQEKISISQPCWRFWEPLPPPSFPRRNQGTLASLSSLSAVPGGRTIGIYQTAFPSWDWTVPNSSELQNW